VSPIETVRAWTDPEYRATLTPEQLALLPEHPAGLVELDEKDLQSVSGGRPCGLTTYGTYTSSGWRCL
jgi:mersacidin/lichenicidin family type 2 lantibiotic